MLGAIYGGRVAANTILEGYEAYRGREPEILSFDESIKDINTTLAKNRYDLRDLLLQGLGIVRTPGEMNQALSDLETLYQKPELTDMDRKRTRLGMAMLMSAIARKESRGAHYRVDVPEMHEEYRKQTCAVYVDGEIQIRHAAPDES